MATGPAGSTSGFGATSALSIEEEKLSETDFTLDITPPNQCRFACAEHGYNCSDPYNSVFWNLDGGKFPENPSKAPDCLDPTFQNTAQAVKLTQQNGANLYTIFQLYCSLSCDYGCVLPLQSIPASASVDNISIAPNGLLIVNDKPATAVNTKVSWYVKRPLVLTNIIMAIKKLQAEIKFIKVAAAANIALLVSQESLLILALKNKNTAMETQNLNPQTSKAQKKKK